jgi:hypothetical protein
MLLTCSLGCYIINCIRITARLCRSFLYLVWILPSNRVQWRVVIAKETTVVTRGIHHASQPGGLPLAVCHSDTGKHSASSEVAGRTFCSHRTVTLPSLQGELHLCRFWCHRFAFNLPPAFRHVYTQWRMNIVLWPNSSGKISELFGRSLVQIS